MKQRKQATSASSSLPSPFDLLPSFEDIQRQKREARKPDLMADVKAILTHLAKCCTSGREQVLWPDENSYARLNEAVQNLSRIARKGPDTRTLWNSYKVVNHTWPKLQLCKRIKDLVERANKNTPERPLEWFARLGQSTGEDGKRAFGFVKLLPEIRSKKCEAASVDWRYYESVFLRFRNSHLLRQQKARQRLCPKVKYPGDQRLIAYTVFLEIDCEDADWCRKHLKGLRRLMNWVLLDLQNMELLRRFERMFESPDVLAQAIKGHQNLPVAMRRELDARAHRRWRAKKSPQKT